MALHVTTDLDEVRDRLHAALAADPVANTVYGSVLASAERPDAAPWAAHPAGEPLVLAARSRATTPVALTSNWTDVTELGGALAGLEPPVAAFASAPAVVDALVSSVGRPVASRMDERLFRLDELVPPAGVSGQARAATPEDTELLVGWFLDFGEEAFGERASDEFVREQIALGLERGTCWLWTVDGTPRSFAFRHAVVAGVSRIGPVYTPRKARGNGYGSAATAAAARQILDAGATACLFTDLANPTSNTIYRALGFRPVLDRCAITFAR